MLGKQGPGVGSPEKFARVRKTEQVNLGECHEAYEEPFPISCWRCAGKAVFRVLLFKVGHKADMSPSSFAGFQVIALNDPFPCLLITARDINPITPNNW